jgi:hypothetical protein
MSAIRYTSILALAPGAPLVRTTAVVAGSPTASFSKASTADAVEHFRLQLQRGRRGICVDLRQGSHRETGAPKPARAAHEGYSG